MKFILAKTGRAYSKMMGRVVSSRSCASAALAAVLLLSVFSPAQAATVTAKSCSLVDVSAAMQLASDGDTVVVPAGTATWANTLKITKGITLQGAGIGQTIVTDGLTADNGNIEITSAAGKFYRVTGFEFRVGTRTASYSKGCMIINGDSKTFRVDNCKFYRLKNRFVRIGGAACGVIDHCTFDYTNSGGDLYILHDTWDGKKWGDGSWAVPLDWGGPGAVYIENNSLFDDGYTGQTNTKGIIDECGGARWVFRYNTVRNLHLDSHGTGSTGRFRSTRHWEIYNNTFSCSPKTASQAICTRGGTGVVFNNTLTGYLKFHMLHTYRYFQYFNFWNGSDGNSGWDLNDTTGGPSGNGIYLSGTASTGSKDLTLVVQGANWTTDQWKGYTVKDTTTTSPLYPDGVFFSFVVSNTKDTIIVKEGSLTLQKPFAPGDHFEIRKVVQSLDQVGASTGDLLSDAVSATPTWLKQTVEPVYEWNNKLDGANAVAISACAPIKEGVHFFNNTPKPNYTPYAYPHPLAALAPPTDLRIVSSP